MAEVMKLEAGFISPASFYINESLFILISHSLSLFSPLFSSFPLPPLIRVTVCVGFLPFCHLLHTDTLTFTPTPPTSPAQPPAHTMCTNTQTKNPLIYWKCTPTCLSRTHNCHFFLSSPFQPLPFIITQPEALQHPVWLPFSTSYPR